MCQIGSSSSRVLLAECGTASNSAAAATVALLAKRAELPKSANNRKQLVAACEQMLKRSAVTSADLDLKAGAAFATQRAAAWAKLSAQERTANLKAMQAKRAKGTRKRTQDPFAEERQKKRARAQEELHGQTTGGRGRGKGRGHGRGRGKRGSGGGGK